MKFFFVVALAAAVTFLIAASAFAVGPGKTILFDGKGAGKVVFDGKTHTGTKCVDCHKFFIMKKGANVITMKDMRAGKACGACHDGKKAFAVKDCAKCHKK